MRLVAALAATTVLCAGCGHAAPDGGAAPQSSASNSPGGAEEQASPSPAATVSSASGALSMSDHSGTVKIGRGAVDPSSLGVPLYPLAAQDPTGSFSSSAADGLTEITTLDSTDPYASIVQWYKKVVPSDAQASSLNVGSESTTSFEWTRNGGREDRVVTINTNSGKPLITISLRISKGS